MAAFMNGLCLAHLHRWAALFIAEHMRRSLFTKRLCLREPLKKKLHTVIFRRDVSSCLVLCALRVWADQKLCVLLIEVVEQSHPLVNLVNKRLRRYVEGADARTRRLSVTAAASRPHAYRFYALVIDLSDEATDWLVRSSTVTHGNQGCRC